MDSKYKVCIRSYTYNQAQYIEDALNGFVMQETDFPFVAAIVDDASTDNAQQAITVFFEKNFDTREPSIAFQEETEYGKVLFARHNVNKNCFFAIVLLKENHFRQKRSKLPYISRWKENAEYIALCEGDDYWTDSTKLQKQVRVLDENPEYIICSHDYIRFYQNSLSYGSNTYYSSLFSNVTSPKSIEYSLDTYFDGWWTQPLTCVYRNGDYLKQIPYSLYRFHRDDIFYYYVLKNGKGILLKDSMGVYRIHDRGVWSRKTMIQRYESTAYNAYNIFLVEGDLRTFRLIDRMEFKILTTLFNEREYLSVVKRLYSYRRKAPKNHYRSVRDEFENYVLNKTKRKIRKLFRY